MPSEGDDIYMSAALHTSSANNAEEDVQQTGNSSEEKSRSPRNEEEKENWGKISMNGTLAVFSTIESRLDYLRARWIEQQREMSTIAALASRPQPQPRQQVVKAGIDPEELEKFRDELMELMKSHVKTTVIEPHLDIHENIFQTIKDESAALREKHIDALDIKVASLEENNTLLKSQLDVLTANQKTSDANFAEYREKQEIQSQHILKELLDTRESNSQIQKDNSKMTKKLAQFEKQMAKMSDKVGLFSDNLTSLEEGHSRVMKRIADLEAKSDQHKNGIDALSTSVDELGKTKADVSALETRAERSALQFKVDHSEFHKVEDATSELSRKVILLRKDATSWNEQQDAALQKKYDFLLVQLRALQMGTKAAEDDDASKKCLVCQRPAAMGAGVASRKFQDAAATLEGRRDYTPTAEEARAENRHPLGHSPEIPRVRDMSAAVRRASARPGSAPGGKKGMIGQQHKSKFARMQAYPVSNGGGQQTLTDNLTLEDVAELTGGRAAMSLWQASGADEQALQRLEQHQLLQTPNHAMRSGGAVFTGDGNRPWATGQPPQAFDYVTVGRHMSTAELKSPYSDVPVKPALKAGLLKESFQLQRPTTAPTARAANRR
jgi:hypothetical protein